MDVAEVKNDIQSKTLKSFYIFTGIEWKIQRIYIDMISKTCDKELKYIDSIKDLVRRAGNRSFISKSYVYVIRDDKDLMSEEKIQDRLNEIIGNNILILLLTTVDKRLKFYKRYVDSICEFDTLKPAILKKYIQKEINLSDKNCDKLMEVCESDYGRILLEIDKIKRFDHEMTIGKDNAFEHLLYDGTIYTPPKDAIFDFVDAILDGKLKLTFDLYEQCLAIGEATMVMITVLYNNAKAVLQVQSCQSNDVSKSTGLTGFQIMNAKKHLDVYTDEELLDIMSLCQECQQGIVMGTIEEEFCMDYILTNIF